MQWLKHAFAVDEDGPAQPTPIQQVAVDWFCLQIARRRLTTPGLLLLEVFRPMNYIGSQLLHVSRPAVWSISTKKFYSSYVALAEYLEKRGSFEYMHQRVEHFEAEMMKREKNGESIMDFIQQHMDQVRSAIHDEEIKATVDHDYS